MVHVQEVNYPSISIRHRYKYMSTEYRYKYTEPLHLHEFTKYKYKSADINTLSQLRPSKRGTQIQEARTLA